MSDPDSTPLAPPPSNSAAENSPAPRRRGPFAVLLEPVAILAVVVALLVGIGGTLGVQGVGSVMAGVVAAAKPELTGKKFFGSALRTCHLDPSSEGVSTGDGGDSLSLDNEGDEDAEGLSIEDEACVLRAVGTPDSTIDKMDATRALDGRQSDTWKHVRASWSYHPDSGLDVILQFRK